MKNFRLLSTAELCLIAHVQRDEPELIADLFRALQDALSFYRDNLPPELVSAAMLCRRVEKQFALQRTTPA